MILLLTKLWVILKRPCTTYLSLTTRNIQGGVLWKKSSETFEQNPWKITKKKSIFSKIAGFKNEFMYMYFSRFFAKILSNLAHDFWENRFPKPKVISCKQTNLFEYINAYIKNSRTPTSSHVIDLRKIMIFISWSRERRKLILRK